MVAAAFAGSQFNPAPGTKTGKWYRKLKKPPFNPPNAVFAPVWSVLYALMAASAYRVWNSPAKTSRVMPLWFAQLGANAAWNPIFFGGKKPLLAMADLFLLGALLAAYIREAEKVDRPAAWLMAPYAGWVGFAGLLNAEIVRRNP